MFSAPGPIAGEALPPPTVIAPSATWVSSRTNSLAVDGAGARKNATLAALQSQREAGCELYFGI